MQSLIYRILGFAGVVFLISLGTVWFDSSPKTGKADHGDTEVAAIPVLAQLPEFSLVDQDGQTFGTKDMRGNVTVINFIFTSCPTTCPLLTRQMRNLQKESVQWRDRLRFASITVDPKHDSAAVLKEYGRKFDADFSQWHFLTGELTTIEGVIVNGFKASLSRLPEAPGARAADVSFSQIAHSENFVVVDQKLQIRAYQTLSGEKEMKGILHLLSSLLSNPV